MLAAGFFRACALVPLSAWLDVWMWHDGLWRFSWVEKQHRGMRLCEEWAQQRVMLSSGMHPSA